MSDCPSWTFAASAGEWDHETHMSLPTPETNREKRVYVQRLQQIQQELNEVLHENIVPGKAVDILEVFCGEQSQLTH